MLHIAGSLAVGCAGAGSSESSSRRAREEGERGGGILGSKLVPGLSGDAQASNSCQPPFASPMLWVLAFIEDREVAQRLQSLGSEDPEHKDAQNHQQSMPKPPIAAQLLPKTFDTLITYENLSFWFRSSPPTMGHAPSVIAGPSILAALTAPGLRPSLVSNAATLQQRHHLAQVSEP